MQEYSKQARQNDLDLIATARGRTFRFHERATGCIVTKRIQGIEWVTAVRQPKSAVVFCTDYEKFVADRWAALPDREKAALDEYERIDAALRRLREKARPSRGFTTNQAMAKYVGITSRQVVRLRKEHNWPVVAGKFYPPADFIAEKKRKASERRPSGQMKKMQERRKAP